MSRHGYSDDGDDDPLALGRWRGAVASTIRGKQGQAFLREVLAALDAIPSKRLIREELRTVEGEFCTLGALGAVRGIDLESIDPEDYDAVAAAFGINAKLAQEIMWENDEIVGGFEYVDVVICGPMRYLEQHNRRVRLPSNNVAERRWRHMREWVAKNIKNQPEAAPIAKDATP